VIAEVDYEHVGGCAWVTLNRPGSLNAIDRAMHDGLVAALTRAGREGSRAVVLRGNGRAFSAGGDVKAVAAGEDVGDPADLAAALASLTMPVIAAVHGYCLGQAFELVQLCDLAVAARDARFGEVEIQHGWAPPIPVTPATLTRKHAMEVLLLGEIFDAEQALRIGVVNRVVDGDDLTAAVTAITDRLCSLDSSTVTSNKALVDSFSHRPSRAR
jgi:enoyl-CoA hydratase/carnithine racemase